VSRRPLSGGPRGGKSMLKDGMSWMRPRRGVCEPAGKHSTCPAQAVQSLVGQAADPSG